MLGVQALGVQELYRIRRFDMSKKSMFSVGFIMLCFVVTVSLSWADGIKLRMKQRLPSIVQMKQQGVIGENERGYLEYLSGNKLNKEIIDAEKSDRQKVYGMIAKQQGVTIDKVERLRAHQIVKKTVKGEFLKKEGGSWYRK